MPSLPSPEEQNVKNMLNGNLSPRSCSLLCTIQKKQRRKLNRFQKWSFLTFTKVLNLIPLAQKILLVERIRKKKEKKKKSCMSELVKFCDLALAVHLFSLLSSEGLVLWYVLD